MQKLPQNDTYLEGGYTNHGMAQSNLKMIKVLMDKSVNERKLQLSSDHHMKMKQKYIQTIQTFFTIFHIVNIIYNKCQL